MSTSPHITPVRTYLTVFGLLMVLTVVTVVVAYFDLKFLNVVMAVCIAVAKASVVALYFMHLRSSARILSVVAVSGAIWMGIMLVGVLTDVLSRSWLPYPPAWTP